MRRLLSNLAPGVLSRFSNLLAANQEKRRPWGRGQAVSAALSYHPFVRYKSVLKNAFCQLISTRLNAFLAFLLFIVEHSGDKQKRKTKELTKGTLHVTCTFLYPQIEIILSVSTVCKSQTRSTIQSCTAVLCLYGVIGNLSGPQYYSLFVSRLYQIENFDYFCNSESL